MPDIQANYRVNKYNMLGFFLVVFRPGRGEVKGEEGEGGVENVDWS